MLRHTITILVANFRNDVVEFVVDFTNQDDQKKKHRWLMTDQV